MAHSDTNGSARLPGPIRRTAGTLEHVLRVLTLTAAYAGMLAIIAIMCVTVANVVARKFFHSSVPSAVEGSQEALVIAVFLGFAAAQRTGTHVATHILTGRLRGGARVAVRTVGLATTLALAIWMLWSTYKQARYTISIHEQIASVINFPTWPGRVAVVVGFTLLVLELARSLILLLVKGTTETPQSLIQGYTLDEDEL